MVPLKLCDAVNANTHPFTFGTKSERCRGTACLGRSSKNAVRIFPRCPKRGSPRGRFMRLPRFGIASMMALIVALNFGAYRACYYTFWTNDAAWANKLDVLFLG